MTDKIDIKVNQTLSATEKLLKFEGKVSGNPKNQAEIFKGYEEFIKAIQAFKDIIEEEAFGNGKLDLDEELSNELWQEITHLEKPSTRKKIMELFGEKSQTPRQQSKIQYPLSSLLMLGLSAPSFMLPKNVSF